MVALRQPFFLRLRSWAKRKPFRMAYECTGIKMAPKGRHHSHIVEIRATNHDTGAIVRGTRQQWVDAVKDGVKAYVRDKYGNVAYLRVNHVGTTEYVQTYADGKWTDNLLALPRFY